MMSAEPIQAQRILSLQKPADIVQVIEQHGPRLGPALGCTALHALAELAGPLNEEERRRLMSEPSVGRLMLQLGSQLSGAGELDAQGLSSILWALARLGQTESPLLNGLVKRLMLLTSHGCVSCSLFLIAVQALAQLKMLGGAVGAAVLSHALGQVMSFKLAELATICRALTEAIGAEAAPLLRETLTKRLGELASPPTESTPGQGAKQALTPVVGRSRQAS